jgi:hypothetical protein
MSEADFAAWASEWRNSPAPIVPVPALSVPPSALRGERVIIGLPGHGWRMDLRADSLVSRGSHSLVPVMPEAEWYRSEEDRLEVFASLVPAERVWLETLRSDLPTHGPGHPGEPPSTLVSLDSPPIRIAAQAREVGHLTGRRVVAVGPEGEERALRAVTEAYSAGHDRVEVRVAKESDWYRWTTNGKLPPTRPVEVTELWVE